MSTITTAILSAVGGSLVTIIIAIVTGLFTFIKGCIKATKATTHHYLFKECGRLLRVGSATEDELENLDELYEAYHALGMNGIGTELYTRCKALPIKL